MSNKCHEERGGRAGQVLGTVIKPDGRWYKRAPEPLCSGPGRNKPLAKCAGPLPQLLIEGAGGIVQDPVYVVLHSPLCHHLNTVQLQSSHSTGLLHQSVKLVELPSLDPTSPAHYHIEQSAGHHSLVEQHQEAAADGEGAVSPEEVQSALCLLIQSHCVVLPVQSVADVDTEVFVGDHHLHLLPMDGNGVGGLLFLRKSNTSSLVLEMLSFGWFC